MAAELNELAYKGNIGVMELARFHAKATPDEKKKFAELMKKKATAKGDSAQKQMAGEIWDHVQSVTGVKLYQMESVFGTYRQALLESVWG